MRPIRADAERFAITAGRAATVAATFADRDVAQGAIKRLRREGFRATWLGMTRADDAADCRPAVATRVDADGLMRFFGAGVPLREALVRHGVKDADVRAAVLAGALSPCRAIVTVGARRQPERAAQIMRAGGGRLITSGFGSRAQRLGDWPDSPASGCAVAMPIATHRARVSVPVVAEEYTVADWRP